MKKLLGIFLFAAGIAVMLVLGYLFDELLFYIFAGVLVVVKCLFLIFWDELSDSDDDSGNGCGNDWNDDISNPGNPASPFHPANPANPINMI